MVYYNIHKVKEEVLKMKQLTEKQIETIKNSYGTAVLPEILKYSDENTEGGALVFNRANTKVWVILDPALDTEDNNYTTTNYDNMFSNLEEFIYWITYKKYKGDLNKFAEDFGITLQSLMICMYTRKLNHLDLPNYFEIEDVEDQLVK